MPAFPLLAPQSPDAGPDAPLTPAQKRFNALTRKIEQQRQALATWQRCAEDFHRGYAAKVQPLDDELRALRRRWATALDTLLQTGRWSPTDRAVASLLLREAAAELLRDAPGDPVLLELFERHAGTDHASERRERALAMKRMAEEMTGLDLGDDDGLLTEDDLRRRLRERMDARDEAAADAARAAPPSPKSAAGQRRERAAAEATKSAREVYRQLASALHPDREPDPAERDAKTALMQEVNRAYAAGDLLQLLELQLRIERIDAAGLAAVPARRLKHYNEVLAGQLAGLKDEIEASEMRFRMEFGLGPGEPLDPRRLGPLLTAQVQAVRAELNERRRELALFDEPDATRRWLKRERRRLETPWPDADPFD